MISDAFEDEYTLAETAAQLRVGVRKVADIAREIGVGINAKGAAGWRFNATEIRQIRAHMKPKPAARRDKRKRIA